MEKTRIELPQWALLPDIGLYMDQVITLMERTLVPVLPEMEITKSMVNNYVKVGLLARPAGKKYDREHLAQLIMIGVLKQALSMDCIAQVLGCLCADGVQAGYTRFAQQVFAFSGGEDAPSACDTPQEEAVRAGVRAAVCTIDARRLLAGLRGGRCEKTI